jgi:hypothetical protein
VNSVNSVISVNSVNSVNSVIRVNVIVVMALIPNRVVSMRIQHMSNGRTIMGMMVIMDSIGYHNGITMTKSNTTTMILILSTTTTMFPGIIFH